MKFQVSSLYRKFPAYLWPASFSTLAMLVVITIPFFGIVELHQFDRRYSTHTFHLLIMLLAVLLLATIALSAEYSVRHKLASDAAKARDRLRMAMTSGKSMGWDWDIKTGQVLWFGDLNALFGIPTETFSGQAQEFGRYVHPDDRERVSQAAAVARTNRDLYAAEFRTVRQDGTIRWVCATGNFFYDRNGEAERMLGIAVDVTDRKSTDEALIKSEEKFSKAFRESPVALTLTSARDHRYLDVNETYEQFTGWKRDEVIGRTPFDIQIWVDPSQREDLVRHTLEQGGIRDFELRYRCKNGDIRAALGSSDLIEIEGETCILSAVLDITDRKRAEEVVLQKEVELAEAQRLARIGSWRWDHKTGALSWSKELYQIHGLDPNQPPPLEGELRPLFTPESWERLRASMTEARETGSVQTVDLELVRPDGSKRWVTARGEAVRDAAGEVRFYRGTTQDITERKQAETRLQEYEKAVEGAEEMVAVMDRDYRYVIANRAFLGHRNMTRDQVIGRLASEVLHEGVFESVVKEKLDECFQGRIVQYEMKYTYPDVGERHLFVSYFPIEGPARVERVACILQDITERKRIEQQLQESQVRLAGVVSSAMDAIIAVDDEQKIVLFNAAAEQMFGCTANEALGTDVGRFIPEGFRLVHREHIRRFGETGITNRSVVLDTLRGLRSNGEEFPMEASISQVQTDGKKMFTVIIRDVTERDRVHEALRQSEQRLHMALRAGKMYPFEFDPSTGMLVRSPEYVEVIGADQPHETTIQELVNCIHPDDQEAFKQSLTRITPEHPMSEVTFRLLRSDGNLLWLEKRLQGFFDKEGKLQRTLGVAVDITNRKLAEDALRESETRFRRVVEHIGDAVIADDVNGHLVFANDRFLQLFGFHREQVPSINLEDYVAPEYRSELRDRHDRRMRGEAVPTHFEYEGIRADGSRMWIEVDVVPITDTTGKTVGTQSALRDVTERKRAERAIQESEQRLRHLISASNDWVWEVDANTVYTYAGPQCREILGYQPNEILGKTPYDLMPPAEAARIAAEFGAIAAQRKPFRALENVNIHKDGHVVVLETNGVPIIDKDGAFRGYRGMDRDITHRRRAEEALRESEERFRRVANTAPVMIWMSGTDKLCDYFNQSWLDFTGRPLGAELGNGWVKAVHAEDVDRCLETYSRAFDARESFEVEYRLRRHDGEYRWLLDRGVPRFNPDGSFAGYIGSCLDVTERKIAEESLGTIGRRLIEAHEEERTWIGRELHDDINQKLALVAVELDRSAQHLHFSDPELRKELHHAQERIVEIARDVQGLSHRLHSSKLEYLGVVSAINSFCKELSD